MSTGNATSGSVANRATILVGALGLAVVIAYESRSVDELNAATALVGLTLGLATNPLFWLSAVALKRGLRRRAPSKPRSLATPATAVLGLVVALSLLGRAFLILQGEGPRQLPGATAPHSRAPVVASGRAGQPEAGDSVGLDVVAWFVGCKEGGEPYSEDSARVIGERVRRAAARALGAAGRTAGSVEVALEQGASLAADDSHYQVLLTVACSPRGYRAVIAWNGPGESTDWDDALEAGGRTWETVEAGLFEAVAELAAGQRRVARSDRAAR